MDFRDSHWRRAPISLCGFRTAVVCNEADLGNLTERYSESQQALTACTDKVHCFLL